MKRTAIVLISIALLLLASCGNTYDEKGADEPPASQAAPWQEAYAYFLRNPSNFTMFQGGAYEMKTTSPPDWIAFHFALRDLTQDGTPELLVFFYGSSSACGSGVDIYTFDGENIVFLDGAFTSRAQRGLSVSSDPYFPGIFFGYGMMGWGYNRYAELIDGQTKITEVLIYEYLYGSGKIIHTQADQQLYGAWLRRSFFPTYEITEDNIRDIIFGWQPPAVTWQEAYTALLQDYAKRSDNLFFFLHDFDGSGTPELLIAGEYPGIDEIYDAVYSFRGGRAISLEFDEGVYIAGYALAGRAGVFVTPDSSPGIITYIAGPASVFGPSTSFSRVVIDGHRLAIDTRGQSYVEVYNGYGIRHWIIDGYAVSYEEFHRVFNRYEGRLQAVRINEDNTRSVISNWRPVATISALIRQNLVLEHFKEHARVRFCEIENRSFDIFYPIVIDGEYFYKIVVLGKLNDGSVYRIDAFAMNIDNNRFYIYSEEINQFVRNSWSTHYRSVTSPNGIYRIEFAEAGKSRLDMDTIFVGFLRIVDLDTGEVLWRSDEIQDSRLGKIAWSPDSAFVAFDSTWIHYTDAIIICTDSFSQVHLLGLDNIANAIADAAGREIEYYFNAIDRWIDASTLQIRFAVDGPIIHGIYQFDTSTGEIRNFAVLDWARPLLIAYEELERSGFLAFDENILGHSVLARQEGILCTFRNRGSLIYAFHDINGDGMPELFIGMRIGTSSCIIAIYTLQNGEPAPVIQAEGRPVISLLADVNGNYVIEYAEGRRMDIAGEHFYALDENGTLISLDRLFTDGLDWSGGGDEPVHIRYRYADGGYLRITEEEYADLLKKYGSAGYFPRMGAGEARRAVLTWRPIWP